MGLFYRLCAGLIDLMWHLQWSGAIDIYSNINTTA